MSATQFDPSSESITYRPPSGDSGSIGGGNGGEQGRLPPPELRFLHFNDVYHVESGSAEPVGGIARFQSVVNYYRDREPSSNSNSGDNTSSVNAHTSNGTDDVVNSVPKLITFFSGDAFNPSLESSVTKGRHMVPVLNGIRVDAACVGNHDLDFGVAQFRHLRKQCKFPWLLANVLDPALGEDVALAGCDKTVLLEASNGIKVGIIGLAEREWLDTINSLPPNLIYQSASETAKRLVPGLRSQGAEIIIAITHQREPNDNKLAEKTPPGLIDIILGGHDHFYGHSLINGTHVLRSGTDFKQLSYIEARRQPNTNPPKWDFIITRRDITRKLPEDPPTVQLVDKVTKALKAKLEKPVGYTAVPLDSRFTTVRTRESNIGNFVCDLMRHFYSTDCALMGAGTIRGDQIYQPGVLRLKDILNCFPFEDPVVVLRVSGQAILSALENGICLVPALEGRFPQVSNIKFAFDPKLPSGARIAWAKINDEPLDKEKKYTLATRGYMARAKDGFTSLLAQSEPGGTAEEVVSEENGVLISMVLRQYFMSLKVLGKWARWSPSLHRHWDGVNMALHASGTVKDPAQTQGVDGQTGVKHRQTGSIKISSNNSPLQNGKTNVEGREVDSDTDDEAEDVGDDGRSTMAAQASAQAFSTSRDRSMHLARKYSRRWMKMAGVEGQDPHLTAQEHAQDWILPHWTHGIAPKLEGRIVNLQYKREHGEA